MESVTGTGCRIFKTKIFSDDRGSFMEAYRGSEFRSIPEIRQTNVSRSSKGTVRGLHFQKGSSAQGKLVRSLAGVALDVVLDLRVGSRTYGKHESFLLVPGGLSIYVPVGFAHGFWVLSEECIFHYGCTKEYDKDNECGISPYDSDLILPWIGSGISTSGKDKNLPMFKDFKSPFRMGDL